MKALDIGGTPRAVLVHGHGLCAEFYEPFARCLAERGVATRLLTLPGYHGEPPLENPGWDALADALLAVVPDGAALIGHSMGGLLALVAAARRPVSRLVLLEPAVQPRFLARAASRRYLRVGARPERFENWNGGQWRVADPSRYPKDMIDRFLDGARTADPATVDALFGTVPDVPDPTVPTLLVTGGAIGWRGRATAEWLALRLRPTRFVLADAGHWLVNEHDDALADAVAAFLR